MVIIWIILGALLLWEIQSVWYAKHWDEELFVSLAFPVKVQCAGRAVSFWKPLKTGNFCRCLS